ncbi:nitrate ABC transporter substrate-binding protein [Rhodococcus sp. 06-412-2C]|uniref:ABC transporter substrate-binding protein n=1 Tax=unclassified Rhodococcus (in: high G+C Gram-positive bacteria) TaxID=192944 RepID=UPI000B9BBB5C|nr:MULTISPECIES: ABC transporter substrate-binding protein [unclassified Rhodococcus (in: high G+C Gram-positive bacteria)]OZC87060.1 nitrate ABC transporter substrate-binding protein [Rhodococcus sp. 06-412-2C]OZC99944.1 nitrate ABC transporter substrate-binding protein [Rhodococcus sp. 06-412-2B]
MVKKNHFVGVAVVLAVAITASACSADEADPTAVASIEPVAAEESLSGVCPSAVTVQLQWQPQSDMGALFEMLGPGYTVDSDEKSVTGPLVAEGKDTGVDITLRAGGPAIGFQSVTSQMYVDDSIDLGIVHGDQVIAAAADQPVVGVTPLLKYSPAILMWDPESHPDWTSIEDIGKSDATVVVSKEQIFPQWLVDKGLLKSSQLDTGYDGAPARFVGDPEIAQQGFANSEPYTYESDTPAWSKPVSYQLVKDTGFDIYASNVSVRADKLEALSPCLDKLVPIVQQATADYITSPDATNSVIVDIVSQDASFTPYTEGEAAFSSTLLKDQGLIADEADGSVGTYDPVRTQSNLTELGPVLTAGGAQLPADLTAEQLFTNRFTDSAIGIG